MKFYGETVHHDAFAPCSSANRARLAKAAAEHDLPARDGAPTSTARMLDDVAAAVAGGDLTNYECDKLHDWAARWPAKGSSDERPQAGRPCVNGCAKDGVPVLVELIDATRPDRALWCPGCMAPMGYEGQVNTRIPGVRAGHYAKSPRRSYPRAAR